MAMMHASLLPITAQGGKHPSMVWHVGRQDPPGRTITTRTGAIQRSRAQQLSHSLLNNMNFTPMPCDFTALPPQLRQEAFTTRSTPSASSASGQQQEQQEQQKTPFTSSKASQRGVSSNSIIPFDTKTTLPSPDGGPGVVVQPDGKGAVRMALQHGGWRTWNWRGHAINWTAACPKDDEIAAGAPTVVLLHGFGGSLYHWRRTLPALAHHSAKVYALDCLGFGWSCSEKAGNEDYSDYKIWSEQVNEFIEEVAGGSEQNKVVLVGNSLGGFTALQAASYRPDLVKGVVLMNACGDIQAKTTSDAGNPAVVSRLSQVMAVATPGPISTIFRRAATAACDAAINIAARAYFQLSKKPENIRSSMQRLYVRKDLVDDDLIESVVIPTHDPGALAVCRAVLGNMFSVERLDSMLDRLTTATAAQKRKIPMLILWGEQDPWMPGSTPDRMKQHYDSVNIVRLPQAGHCPQDDAAEEVNDELMRFLEDVQVDSKREKFMRR